MFQTPTVQHIGRTGVTPVATPLLQRKKVYYTGITSNTTASSRTIIAEDILPGYVVCYDPFVATGTVVAPTATFPGDVLNRYKGIDVTKPQTSLLMFPAGIVTQVPDGSKRGGVIEIATGPAVDALVTTAGAISAGAALTVIDASWALQPMPAIGDVSSGAANLTAIINLIRRFCAKALQDESGAVTNVTRTVAFMPMVGGDC